MTTVLKPELRADTGGGKSLTPHSWGGQPAADWDPGVKASEEQPKGLSWNGLACEEAGWSNWWTVFMTLVLSVRILIITIVITIIWIISGSIMINIVTLFTISWLLVLLLKLIYGAALMVSPPMVMRHNPLWCRCSSTTNSRANTTYQQFWYYELLVQLVRTLCISR